ncbi:hypothetical protein [Salisediminibacterium halotolerans]|uniref:hypothetical protein n=1 Tax=Salisediminibacterium halotolerans TaxID=517425 RepID=UPI000F4DA9EF|nr:hypothetical protein [Salisediminibacterium halotolerans]
MLSSDVNLIKDRMTTHRPAYFLRAGSEPLRADALQGLVCLAFPREKAGMLGHPLFKASLFIRKKPCIHSSDASGKARDEDPDSAV